MEIENKVLGFYSFFIIEMKYFLVQNNYGKNKRMLHQEGCRYLKNTRDSYLLYLGGHNSLKSAVREIENRNFDIAYCKRCIDNLKLDKEVFSVLSELVNLN